MWDAYKVTMRRILIELNKRYRKQKEAKMKDTGNMIVDKETELKSEQERKKL